MSNLSMRHPDEGTLLRYIDDELPGRKRRQIGRHLAACWQCRTEIEELQATIADCMHYRKDATAPEPPQPWIDITREFDRIDESFASEPFWKSLWPRIRPLRWSMAAAAAMALICAVIYNQLRETPSVQAATLLKRAVAAAAQHPQAAHRYRIRTRTMPIASEAPLPAKLAARIEAAHYDSADPLSARAFQAWRDSLAVRTDEVSTVSGPAGIENYRIHTLAPEGELASATLTLRSTDLDPVEGMLELRPVWPAVAWATPPFSLLKKSNRLDICPAILLWAGLPKAIW
jgi:hypothetical protein